MQCIARESSVLASHPKIQRVRGQLVGFPGKFPEVRRRDIPVHVRRNSNGNQAGIHQRLIQAQQTGGSGKMGSRVVPHNT